MRSERGATLIFVAVAIAMLTAFCAFVFDYGVMWLSRGEAQNAADAGALAGVTSLAFDSSDATVNGAAYQSAVATAELNTIFGEPATAVATLTGSSGPFGSPPSCSGSSGAAPNCVEVDVYRDGTNGSQTLPSFFANIFGVTSQSVRATATAQIGFGNMSQCLKPWIVVDRFSGPDWLPTNKPFVLGTDTYFPPATSTPTGWNRQDLVVGTTLTIPPMVLPSPTTALYYLPLNLPGGYLSDISGCASGNYSIDDLVQLGSGSAGQDSVVANIVAQDPMASVDTATGAIIDSCAPTCGCGSSCANGLNGYYSPRIMNVALLDPSIIANGGVGVGTQVAIVNILSFLIYPSTSPGVIQGVLVSTPGLLNPNAASVFLVSNNNGFIVMPQLVR